MTKDKVLSILKQADGYVSGEEMSRTLNISRAAVNGAIKSLRGEGYVVASATNKGYLLQSSPDRLTAGELLTLVPAKRMERVVCLDSVTSTNDYLRTMALEGAPSGQIVVANCQTKGRGRKGRNFQSPADKGVYMSMLLRPQEQPSDVAQITAWTAVAMCGAVKKTCGRRPGIKWINDLVLDDKKVCGILTELSVEGESGHIQFLIIGVGVNANETDGDFAEEIKPVATSLLESTGKPVIRAELAANMINAFDTLQKEWPTEKNSYLEAYRQDCLTPGKQVRVISAERERTGYAVGIDDSFGLEVRYDDGGTQVVSSGEVSVRGMYGYV